jgi:gamma-glutamylcyclotransferase (GGCT)/AIG2-like uncharacterized protein YtfP
MADDLPLPIFAYGTLRDAAVLTAIGVFVTARGPAVAFGRRHDVSATFPAVSFTAPNEAIDGELLWLNPAEFERAIRRLDEYEGTPSLFQRVQIVVCHEDQEIQAYAYGWSRG